MGSGHSHGHTGHSEPTAQAIAARKKANRILAAVLIPLTLLTLAAMAALWPSGSREGLTLANPYAAAPGVTFDTGRIQRVVTESCSPATGQDPPQGSQGGAQDGGGSQCTFAFTEPDQGGNPVKVVINPDVAKSHGVQVGDNIRYLNLSNAQGAAAAQGSPSYIFVDFVRTMPIILLAVLYALVVVAVARWRGLRALIGLVGAYFVLVSFMLPGLVEGKPPLLLALVGSTVIMIGVLYFAHGFSARTSTALLGTMFGLGITALLAAWATDAANLAGVGSHDASTLVNISGSISISGIILCGLIISGLGVLNDVTITQSSAVWQLHLADPDAGPASLYRRGMQVGRDHIGATVDTLILAYAGAALPLLIFFSLADRSFGEVITSSLVGEEVVRSLVGAIGLVLSVPITTGLAAVAAAQAPVDAGAASPPPVDRARAALGQLLGRRPADPWADQR